jgi:hypothetical protein
MIVTAPTIVSPTLTFMLAATPFFTPATLFLFTAPVATVIANFVATMLIAPRLVILGSVILPNLCFRLRGPCYEHHQKHHRNENSLHAVPLPAPAGNHP